MSVNIELPSDKGLEVLAPQKPKRALLKPMHQISNKIIENKENKRLFKKGDSFVPAGQSTQLIVGATPDKDLSILKLSEALYGNFNLKRVYYSAFVPTVTDPRLPALIKPPLLREHRLYQADWLLRFYGFEADELLSKSNPNFNPELDPKADWAMRNLHMFPIEVNSAEYELLLRVPGIGVKSAQRIITARRVGRLTFDNLKKIGVVLKRAGHFLTCQGKTYDSYSSNEAIVKESLISANLQPKSKKSVLGQMSLFSLVNDSGTDESISEFLLTDSPSNNRQWLSYYNQPQDGRLLLSDIHL